MDSFSGISNKSTINKSTAKNSKTSTLFSTPEGPLRGGGGGFVAPLDLQLNWKLLQLRPLIIAQNPKNVQRRNTCYFVHSLFVMQTSDQFLKAFLSVKMFKQNKLDSTLRLTWPASLALPVTHPQGF